MTTNPLYPFPLPPETVADEHSKGTLVSTLQGIYKNLVFAFHPDRNGSGSYGNGEVSPNSLLSRINVSMEMIKNASKQQLETWVSEYCSPSSGDKELAELLDGIEAKIDVLEEEKDALESKVRDLEKALREKLKNGDMNKYRKRIKELEEQLARRGLKRFTVAELLNGLDLRSKYGKSNNFIIDPLDEKEYCSF